MQSDSQKYLLKLYLSKNVEDIVIFVGLRQNAGFIETWKKWENRRNTISCGSLFESTATCREERNGARLEH